MNTRTPTRLDRALAKVCQHCPLCRRARKEQAGAAWWIVSRVERRLCPFCRAYKRVYVNRRGQPLK
jgi:hypothetical protein